MGVKVNEYEKVCVIEVDGDLSGDNARLAQTALQERTEQKHSLDFVVDLSKCSFIDSEGLETLLSMKRRCEDLFCQVKLAQVDDNCRTILQITRLEHRFETYDDLTSAVKMMR